MYSRYAKIRDSLNLNDLQVAEKAVVPPTTIYDWKQRSLKDPKASMSVSNLLKISAALGCDLKDIIDSE